MPARIYVHGLALVLNVVTCCDHIHVYFDVYLNRQWGYVEARGPPSLIVVLADGQLCLECMLTWVSNQVGEGTW